MDDGPYYEAADEHDEEVRSGRQKSELPRGGPSGRPQILQRMPYPDSNRRAADGDHS